ncbi:MAG: hypothetical protein JW702_07955 [Clostridiales bacterium]|nr:hypothetical protein [Clostridiales bacterium]
MKKEMRENKEEFFILTEQMMDIMAKFCLRAFNAFEASKGVELNYAEINQIAAHEIKAIISQIADPKFSEIVVKKAEKLYQQKIGNQSDI